ncbi:MAG: hypothetical protein CL678_12070 [Bdellovibrionaceae bacterium]|nr:hypothetical protein [Pseudobdellovibrionaceae bacterium]|tara:strand:- start:11800 stop:12159 length:360 start_codon:yes stop_codon:yes gene_type:complete
MKPLFLSLLGLGFILVGQTTVIHASTRAMGSCSGLSNVTSIPYGNPSNGRCGGGEIRVFVPNIGLRCANCHGVICVDETRNPGSQLRCAESETAIQVPSGGGVGSGSGGVGPGAGGVTL